MPIETDDERPALREEATLRICDSLQNALEEYDGLVTITEVAAALLTVTYATLDIAKRTGEPMALYRQAVMGLNDLVFPPVPQTTVN